MAPKGVYVFYNRCIRDPDFPHGLLFKVGGGIIPDRFESAKSKEGTYIPFPYEVGCAKVTGEDWMKYETYLHKKFAAYSITYHRGSGCGDEWFRIPTLDMIRKAMEDIPGEWYQQEMGKDDIAKLSPDDQFKQLTADNIRLSLKTIQAYIESKADREFFVDDPQRTFSNLWTNWYEFLGINTSMYPKTKKEWIEKCMSLGITNATEYIPHSDKSLPPEPSYLYPGFTSINQELGYVEHEVI